MKQVLTALFVFAVTAISFALPAAAQHGRGGRGYLDGQQTFRVQIGEFEPRGESRYWDDTAFDFTGDADDFADAAAGVSYVRQLGERLGFQVSGLFYEGVEDLSYRDFVDDAGFEILHATELETSYVTVGLLFNLTGRRSPIKPYVGVGGGLYIWRLAEFGDFIDFSSPDLDIFDDFFEDEDEELGWYYQVGVQIPVTRNVAAFAEGRWDRAEADLGGDFEGLGELDLSGRTYSAGLSWSF